MVDTVIATLAERVRQDADVDMVSCGQDWRSVGDVYRRARRIAAGLFELGVRPGERVASMMSNRDEAVDLFFACNFLGAIYVPLNVFLKGEFLRYQLADAEPRVVIADRAGLPLIRQATAGEQFRNCLVVALDDGDVGRIHFAELDVDGEQHWPDPTLDDISCLLYTSGTTGMPKGCIIGNGYLVNMCRAHQHFGWFTRDDTSLCPLPLYHGFALSALMDALVGGCRVAFDPEFSASGLLDRARELGATQLFGVGAMATALLATPTRPDDHHHQIDRAIFIPLSPQIRTQLERRFGVRAICEGYGQTEVVPATMGVGGDVTDTGRASAGRAVPWLDVQVLDEVGHVLPAGQTGEIVVRPREPYSMFSGYWRKEVETLAAWQDLWHHTGDLGFFDDDSRLFFVDRKKDALRRRGENVSSVELEQAILRHPAVVAAAAHAVPAGSNEDDIKVCLVLEADAVIAPADLFRFFSSNLPYYAVPRFVEIVDELPTNAVGRVLKHKLRDRWDSPATVDLKKLGLVVGRDARR
ncbi:crotonobetaine/carnitine-CoA ligase [Jatrophihabitans sp. GAS493]|uniref:AMP-binding protein n=1 Tax=Jatrophihabitans sp. GAS493 TaxID=1907575 RepID=UPI000BBF8DB9|nr:AMP-binding protein [Jatrophihabitans sp. GAS493]SOD72097.1 crotonobetaine/carnitine-CoA ligase [Jatrophihabitans sp. GAS493]